MLYYGLKYFVLLLIFDNSQIQNSSKTMKGRDNLEGRARHLMNFLVYFKVFPNFLPTDPIKKYFSHFPLKLINFVS